MPLPRGTRIVGAKKVPIEEGKDKGKCHIQLFGTTPNDKSVHYIETRKKAYPCKPKAKKSSK